MICKGNRRVRIRKFQHENKNCRKQVSLDALKKRCEGEHTCEFSLKELTLEKGQSKKCKPGNIKSATIKYNCQAGKIRNNLLTSNQTRNINNLYLLAFTGHLYKIFLHYSERVIWISFSVKVVYFVVKDINIFRYFEAVCCLVRELEKEMTLDISGGICQMFDKIDLYVVVFEISWKTSHFYCVYLNLDCCRYLSKHSKKLVIRQSAIIWILLNWFSSR